MLRILVACEESQRVCTEFRKLGHEAYSADIQEPSGGTSHNKGNKDKAGVSRAGGAAKVRSKTFKGIAHAMATQWSEYLTGKSEKQLSLFDEEGE